MSNQPQKPPIRHQTKTSPFKKVDEFEQELKDFANKYKTTISEHSCRISDYFEMSCYNLIVRYYEHQGYKATIENEQKGQFRFKCSPAGLIENFSYMKLTKDNETYHLYHNAPIQSAHDPEVFTTPDIVVASDAKSTVTIDYYKTKKKFSYLHNSEMITFCEAKHHTPFPELIINFIGTVNELKPSCMYEEEKDYSVHIAPSLMMSGCLSKPTEKVGRSLEKRYFVNVLGDLFMEPYKTTFSATGIKFLATLGNKRIVEVDENK